MTIKDVAKAANVSPSAVSRYLNGGSVSGERAARIRAAIASTGYHPNTAAQRLRGCFSGQVGIIVPCIQLQSMSLEVSGITSALEERGYLAALGNTDCDDKKELAYLDVMQTNQVSGIILLTSFLTPAKADSYRACKVPLVITGQNVSGFSCIYHDDFNAAKDLTSRMLAKGRRQIVYIGVTEREAAVGIARHRGVQAALDEAGLDGAALPFVISDFSVDSGCVCMEELLKTVPRPDGVVCATDYIAHGAMAALKAHGIRIPEEVSIAGIGDNWADTISTPPLTTARLYYRQCGEEAAKLLAQMLDSQKREPVRQLKLGYTIIDRESI